MLLLDAEHFALVVFATTVKEAFFLCFNRASKFCFFQHKLVVSFTGSLVSRVDLLDQLLCFNAVQVVAMLVILKLLLKTLYLLSS